MKETDGDLEKAEDWLRKKESTLHKKICARSLRGLITVSINNSSGVIIEINSETDFVARNENFQKFCLDITNLCLIKKINDVESLLKVDFDDSGNTVENELTNVISKLGENIVIKKLNYEFHEGNFSKNIYIMLFLIIQEKLGCFYPLVLKKVSTKMLNFFLNNYVCIFLLAILFQLK